MLVPLEKPSRDIDFGTPTMDRVEKAQRDVDECLSVATNMYMASLPLTAKKAAETFRKALAEYEADPSVITVQRDPRKLVEWFKNRIAYYEALAKLSDTFSKGLNSLYSKYRY